MPTTITASGITFADSTVQTTSASAAGSIGTTQLAANAVTTAKVADANITAAKLGATENLRIAKAWVNFNGSVASPTIRSSYNVSSITKNATGDYTANFTNAMADANYAVVGTCNLYPASSLNATITEKARATSSVSVYANYAGWQTPYAFDPTYVSIQVFGN